MEIGSWMLEVRGYRLKTKFSGAKFEAPSGVMRS
jgi:hypothetical protein